VGGEPRRLNEIELKVAAADAAPTNVSISRYDDLAATPREAANDDHALERREKGEDGKGADRELLVELFEERPGERDTHLIKKVVSFAEETCSPPSVSRARSTRARNRTDLAGAINPVTLVTFRGLDSTPIARLPPLYLAERASPRRSLARSRWLTSFGFAAGGLKSELVILDDLRPS